MSSNKGGRLDTDLSLERGEETPRDGFLSPTIRNRRRNQDSYLHITSENVVIKCNPEIVPE